MDTPAAGAGGDEVEQPPEDVGRADAGGQEPNDAPDPSGGTPPPEDGEQAGTDSEDGEIEMPPRMSSGRATMPETPKSRCTPTMPGGRGIL